MKRIRPLFLLTLLALLSLPAAARQDTTPQRPTQADEDEVVRISSELVQTSVVVTDKNDNLIRDLKLDDFEVYENGKRQDVKFMEFVSVEGERRAEGARAEGERAGALLPRNARIERELAARDVRRVIAFVVDDLTIPYNDMVTVRQVLDDFVDNKMQQGDLVAIIRTVGGKGMLEQLTSDKETLRRAVKDLRSVTANPFANVGENQAAAILQQTLNNSGIGTSTENFRDIGIEAATTVLDESTRINRLLIGLATAQNVIESLRDIPGRKSLVLMSGGIPGFGAGGKSTINADGAPIPMANTSAGLGPYLDRLLKLLADAAVRSGVVINTMDPRGLNASPGVRSFQDTPAGSGLGFGGDPNFGHGGSELDAFGSPLDGADEHLSLRLLSDTTGGVSVTNTNDMKLGLDKILARSRGYYMLAYSPAEKFDNKFRKLDIKVKRDGVRLYKYSGYLAREEKRSGAPPTKEQEIAAAASAPLARRDVDVTANLSMRMTPPKGAALDINLLIDPKTLGVEEAGGKYPFSFDVVGFVIDERGKTRGGFSQTISGALTPEAYSRAESTGLTYSAATQLPPGYYQLRVVVRESGSGRLGTVSRYVEVPDISKGRLALSSIFLHAVDFGGSSQPTPLTVVRRLSRKQDLRYTAVVYNAKLEAGKPRLLMRTIVSRDDRIIYHSPEQPATPHGGNPSQLALVEQIGLSKLLPGHYLLTVIVTDALSDKKEPLTRSIDFTVVD
ncbi:MAG: VWA domain-containing protein [Pyrinomonadaceae bacterium]